MAAPPPSQLDANQVLQHAFNDADGTLRVDATFSGTVGEVQVIDADGDSLGVNSDGSIDVNVVSPLNIEISATDGDNIAISDGTNTVSVNPDGSLNTNLQVNGADVSSANPVSINAIDLDIRNLSAAQDNIAISDGINTVSVNPDGSLNTNLQVAGLDVSPSNSVPVSATDLDIRNLSASEDFVAISDGTNTLDVNTDGSINVQVSNLPLPIGAATEAKQDIQIATLNSLDFKMPQQGPAPAANSIPVVLATDVPVDVSLNAFTLTSPDNVQTVGSVDGTATGTKYGYVNNILQQILLTQDRVQDIIYADFGTKNQRVTQINYTSNTFAGFIARKNISYTLVGNRYRRDSITWSIV